MHLVHIILVSYKQMNFKIVALPFFFTWYVISSLAFAQDYESNNQSIETPNKYNKNFEGIGPKVYILPPPKTEGEILTEKYALKKQNQHQIDSLLVNLNLKKELKRINTTSPSAPSKDSLGTELEEDQLISIIDYYKKEGNENYISDWQNNLAIFYFISGEFDKATTQFLESLRIKKQLGLIDDQFIILTNLALLEAEVGNNVHALALYDQLLEDAKKTKNITHQAMAYLAMAKLEAKSGDFITAHNLIIKKSVPLLHRSKNYSGVVIALNELASFKEMQKSDIEAKWIYLQAVDVAQKYKDETGLAISLFNLARLKNRIGDDSLAISDYLASKELAVKNKMEDLLVEIQDGLGDAYLKLNDYKAAALALNEYQSLKINLLNQHLFPKDLIENQ